jgi:hypothetical protein
MGGGGSKPAEITVIEEEPPAGSGESSVIYPVGSPPRLDGISRALANECSGCDLQVVSGISSSSVKISREFGAVSEQQCRRYATDLKRVRDKMMSWQDFLNNLQSGRYLRSLNNGYCEQVQLPADEAEKVTKVDDFKEDKLVTLRIQKVTSGGFSASTKAKFTPSIPFKIQVSAGGRTKGVMIKTMTLYHPCPLRLEGIQPDAVLSLNDPSFDNPDQVVVLIPLVGRNVPSNSVNFLQKIMSQVTAIAVPDPSTGEYVARDIPTGANWTLSKVFDIQPSQAGNLTVKNGYYSWKGMPPLERKVTEGPGTITYGWTPSGSAPEYIMLDSPVVCSPADLAMVTAQLPVTPSLDAIHAVLYSDNPMNRGIVHKQGPPGASCPTRERFTGQQDLQSIYALGDTTLTEEEEACDAWTAWASRVAGKQFTTQQVINTVLGSIGFLAMCIGAYFAFYAVLRLYDVEYAEVAKKIGKIVAVFSRNLQQSAVALQNKVSAATRSPGQGAVEDGNGDGKELENAKDAEALGDVKELQALGNLFADPKPAAVGNDVLTVAPGAPTLPPALAALAAPAAQSCPVGTKKDAKTGSCLPTPEGQGKLLGKTGDGLATLRGGRTLRRDRGRAGLTRRGVH